MERCSHGVFIAICGAMGRLCRSWRGWRKSGVWEGEVECLGESSRLHEKTSQRPSKLFMPMQNCRAETVLKTQNTLVFEVLEVLLGRSGDLRSSRTAQAGDAVRINREPMRCSSSGVVKIIQC